MHEWILGWICRNGYRVSFPHASPPPYKTRSNSCYRSYVKDITQLSLGLRISVREAPAIDVCTRTALHRIKCPHRNFAGDVRCALRSCINCSFTCYRYDFPALIVYFYASIYNIHYPSTHISSCWLLNRIYCMLDVAFASSCKPDQLLSNTD